MHEEHTLLFNAAIIFKYIQNTEVQLTSYNIPRGTTGIVKILFVFIEKHQHNSVSSIILIGLFTFVSSLLIVW